MSRRRRCLVVHPGAVGDVLLALPALAHLGALGFERTLAATLGLTALFRGSDCVEATTDFDDLGLHRIFTAEPDRSVLRALAVYDAVVSWFGAGDPDYRVHLASLGRPLVIARATPPPASGRHVSRYLLETLAPLGTLPADVPRIRLTAGVDERAWAAAWLGERGLGPREAIVLHPGAGSPAKVWPGFPALARRLAAAALPVVAVTGPADAAVAGRLVEDGTLAKVRLACDLPLRDLAALLETARVFVGNDSGPTHLAAVVGCPTVALFGPTDARVWSPGYPAEQRPHVRVAAGRGAGAADPWEGLTVDRVEAAALDLSSTSRAPIHS